MSEADVISDLDSKYDEEFEQLFQVNCGGFYLIAS